MENNINFLTPEEEVVIENEVIKTPEQTTNLESEKVEFKNTIDFIQDVEETKGDGEEEIILDTKEAKVETSDYYDTFMELIENGYIDADNLPEDINTEADTPTTAEDTLKALIHNLSTRDQKVLKYGQDTLLGQLPKEMQEAIAFATNKGNPLEYLKLAIETQDIKSLDPTNEEHQEKIVREFYKTTDLTAEEINEKIVDLKDTGLISKEATKLKPKLDKRAEDVATAKLESQREIKAQKDRLLESASARIVDTIVKSVDGIKFNQQEATEFMELLMEEKEFDYGTHKATKTGVEFLIDFHKYSTNGDPNRLIKALMILDPQGRYDEKFSKPIEKKTKEKFVTDHVTNSSNKFKLGETKEKDTPKTTKKSEAKKSFKFHKY